MGSETSQPIDTSHIQESMKAKRVEAKQCEFPEEAMNIEFTRQYMLRQDLYQLENSKLSVIGTKRLCKLVQDLGLSSIYYDKSLIFKSDNSFLHVQFTDQEGPRFEYSEDMKLFGRLNLVDLGPVKFQKRQGYYIYHLIRKLNAAIPAHKNHQEFIDYLLQMY